MATWSCRWIWGGSRWGHGSEPAKRDERDDAQRREGLALIKTDGPFDIIFCDLMMPVISGTAFYKALEAIAPHMLERLVFMTGGVFSIETNEFLDSVPNTCIEKPFDIGALVALINERVR